MQSLKDEIDAMRLQNDDLQDKVKFMNLNRWGFAHCQTQKVQWYCYIGTWVFQLRISEDDLRVCKERCWAAEAERQKLTQRLKRETALQNEK